MSDNPFLGMADLVARWTYTRMGAFKVTQHPDFPAPAFTINQGRVKVWQLDQVKAFEQMHPRLTRPKPTRYALRFEEDFYG